MVIALKLEASFMNASAPAELCLCAICCADKRERALPIQQGIGLREIHIESRVGDLFGLGQNINAAELFAENGLRPCLVVQGHSDCLAAKTLLKSRNQQGRVSHAVQTTFRPLLEMVEQAAFSLSDDEQLCILTYAMTLNTANYYLENEKFMENKPVIFAYYSMSAKLDDPQQDPAKFPLLIYDPLARRFMPSEGNKDIRLADLIDVTTKRPLGTRYELREPVDIMSMIRAEVEAFKRPAVMAEPAPAPVGSAS